MQTLESIKSKSQESINKLLEKGKEQPEEVKTWGVTAGGAVVGAIAVTAVAKGVIAVLATLAAPPVSLAVGAVGGGLLSWNYINGQGKAEQREEDAAAVESVEPAFEAGTPATASGTLPM